MFSRVCFSASFFLDLTVARNSLIIAIFPHSACVGSQLNFRQALSLGMGLADKLQLSPQTHSLNQQK
jgi:hypothetical protein